MAKREGKAELVEVKALLGADPAYLRTMVQSMVQAALEAEMTDHLGASRSERTGERRGYRSGYYERRLITRVGTLELRIPQDRAGEFSTEVFERYQRSEKALTAALFEMYVQGVSTRKVKAITEELCGHGFSASTVSAIVRKLDDSLAEFARRRLEQPLPYLILDARYEKVREGGSVGSQAVLVAVAVDWDGRRQIVGVEMANRESASSWREFLTGLRERGLHGVEFVVSDDHAGLKKAIREVFPEAGWQRCYVHTIRTQSTLCASVPEWRSDGRRSAGRAAAARRLPGRGGARVRRVHPNEVCPCREPEARQRRATGRSGLSSSAPAMVLTVSPAPIAICFRPIHPNRSWAAPTVPARSSKEERHARRHLCPRLH
jgi:transposase-like protein